MASDHWRFGISRNIYQGLIAPLLKSENVANSDGLLALQQGLHRQLWRSEPQAFDGAVAGQFQELLLAYDQAVNYSRRIQLGGVKGEGGDIVIFGKGITRTLQLKVAASTGISQIQEHIGKAGWQLSGGGGESPPAGSSREIRIVIQDAAPFATLGPKDWIDRVIRPALNEGYQQNKILRDKAALFRAIHTITVRTPLHEFDFSIPPQPAAERDFEGIAFRDRPANRRVNTRYVFNGHWLQAHWRALASWVRSNPERFDIADTANRGVASGAKAPRNLPCQNADGTVVIDPLEMDRRA